MCNSNMGPSSYPLGHLMSIFPIFTNSLELMWLVYTILTCIAILYKHITLIIVKVKSIMTLIETLKCEANQEFISVKMLPDKTGTMTDAAIKASGKLHQTVTHNHIHSISETDKDFVLVEGVGAVCYQAKQTLREAIS